MDVPLSWIKDFVDIDMTVEELARQLTMLGLEVEAIRLVGLEAGGVTPQGLHVSSDKHEFPISGLSWERDKLVVAQIDEVLPHPNADRLVLCRLNDGSGEIVVLTGAPNLFPYKGEGTLNPPLKVAYAREGARLYDGHQPGEVLTTLKRTKIRGVESFSMVCSEKELGISGEHEGVIILDADAPTGMPLVDYMGDAVFSISILANMARNASVLGVARELAALTGKPLHPPARAVQWNGPDMTGRAAIQITQPELNPRFVLGLVEGIEVRPSPYWVQRRLRLAGMRPINAIVDATNYVMLELGEPLHAFDYDVLVQRAGGKLPTIITRTATQGEKLTTLDGVEHALDDFSVLVCDTAGALSIAGVMGGLESEVSDKTRNVLLEGASWNFINIRRTLAAQKTSSEAAFRFSRGVHPALAEWGVRLGLERMRQWAGGVISQGLVDAYPLPPHDPEASVTVEDVRRVLNISLSAAEIAAILTRLEFTCRVQDETVSAQTPPHRLDIGEELIGRADLLEEIARIYGYDNIPATRLADELPPQRRNRDLEAEEKVRDVLVALGLQEVMTLRLTSPEREARRHQPGAAPSDELYVRLANPISPERAVMRRSLLAAVLEITERNSRLRDRQALFEIGPIFIPQSGETLPAEPRRLVLVLTGLRQLPDWDSGAPAQMDFFDLKGLLEGLLDELHITGVGYMPVTASEFHPGKCAQISAGEVVLGRLGELHPRVKEAYDFRDAPVLAAEIDLEALLSLIPVLYDVESVPAYPPVLEDIALVVDEDLPAGQVDAAIRQAGGALLVDVRLFDIFRGGQLGSGKKSLAYSLTYQAPDRTLNDSEAAQVRQKIVRRLEQTLGARLRSA